MKTVTISCNLPIVYDSFFVLFSYSLSHPDMTPVNWLLPVCLPVCLMAPRPLRATNNPSAQESAGPSVSLALHRYVCLSPYVIHVSFNKPSKSRAGAGCSVKVEAIQRDTAQCLMTPYNYTYPSLLAEQSNAMRTVLCWRYCVMPVKKHIAG